MYLPLLHQRERRNFLIIDGAFEYLAWRRQGECGLGTYIFVRCTDPEDTDSYQLSISDWVSSVAPFDAPLAFGEDIDMPEMPFLLMRGVRVARTKRRFSRYAIADTLDPMDDCTTTITTYEGELFLPSPCELREADSLVGDWPEWKREMLHLLGHTNTKLLWPRTRHFTPNLLA